MKPVLRVKFKGLKCSETPGKTFEVINKLIKYILTEMIWSVSAFD